MGRRLSAVGEHKGAHVVGHCGDLFNGIHRAQGIAHVHDGDELHTLVEHVFELVQKDVPIVIDGNYMDARTDVLTDDLPGDDVGVVLHIAEKHDVSCLQIRAAPGVGHEVDCLGTSLREDDLFVRGGIEVAAYCGAGGVELPSGALTESMDPTMNVQI